MSQNLKSFLAAWYRDGSLMLIEEYDRDRLKRGDYLKKPNTTPISKVINGKGIATLFDADGKTLRKVSYQEGLPQDDDISG